MVQWVPETRVLGTRSATNYNFFHACCSEKKSLKGWGILEGWAWLKIILLRKNMVNICFYILGKFVDVYISLVHSSIFASYNFLEIDCKKSMLTRHHRLLTANSLIHWHQKKFFFLKRYEYIFLKSESKL